MYSENIRPESEPEYSLVSYDPCKLHFPYPSCLDIVSPFIETEKNKEKGYENSVSRQPK